MMMIIVGISSVVLLPWQLSTLVPQQQWPGVPKTNSDICFVTCIFGKNVFDVDQPANVEWYIKHWPNVQFIVVTNLEQLHTPGWTKVTQQQKQNPVSNSSYHENYIVQSREAKFLGWKVVPNLSKDCSIVIYVDGYLRPKVSWYETRTQALAKFQSLVSVTQTHDWGLSQVPQQFFNGLSMTTILNNLVRDHKDTIEHVNATLQWFHQQEDYEEVMTYYLNKYFGTFFSLSPYCFYMIFLFVK
jgi:hypothetical protein